MDSSDEGATLELPVTGAVALEASVAPPVAGQTLVERYTVLRVLGEGGMGVVLSVYDARLDRRVALKLRRPGGGERAARDEAGTRVVREAQAMARLSHPNVVAVYDAGTLEDGRFYIAMEEVPGQTLRQWQEKADSAWGDVLRSYVAAGRGLAAAHLAGVIHRDFKPDNVLVGEDGRVRVMDFGLAAPAFSDAGSAGGPGAGGGATPSQGVPLTGEVWESKLTVAGTVMGTPRYLAPELLSGAPATAASDVFAFCVSLYEALYRQPAFPGRGHDRLRAHAEGRVSAPPAATPVPGWIGRVLLQGLDVDPRARPLPLSALLDTLEDDPAARRRARARGAALALSLVGLAGAAAAGWWRAREEGPRCDRVVERLAGVWDPTVQTRMRAAFVGTGRPYAQDAFERAAEGLTRYAQAWTRAQEASCEASRRAPSEQVRLEERCLGRRYSQLRALAQVLSQSPASDDLVKRAALAVGTLESLESCQDERALQAAAAPPQDPTIRTRVEGLEGRLDSVHALRAAGQFREGLERAKELSTEAEAVGWEPLRARATLAVAQLTSDTGGYDAAEQLLRTMLPLAARARDDEAVLSATLLLVDNLALRGAVDDAVRWLLPLEVASERAGSAALAGAATNIAGTVLGAAGRFPEVRQRFERALEQLRLAHGPAHPSLGSPQGNLGTVLLKLGDHAAAVRETQKALALYERTLGPRHPTLAMPLNNLAVSYSYLGRGDEAMAALERALALWESAVGTSHPSYGMGLSNLGILQLMAGRVDDAEPRIAQGLAILEKALGAAHVRLVDSLRGLGDVYLVRGEPVEAERVVTRALEILAASPVRREDLIASTLVALAGTKLERGALGAARTLLTRARALSARAGPADATLTGELLDAEGRLASRDGRLDEARRSFEQALAAYATLYAPAHVVNQDLHTKLAEVLVRQGERAKAAERLASVDERAPAHIKARASLVRASLLWAEVNERPRALGLAGSALEYYRRHGHRARLREAEDWLATRR